MKYHEITKNYIFRKFECGLSKEQTAKPCFKSVKKITKWDKEKNKCFAGFVVSGENVGVDETITVSGEALSFLSTGIDTRVYYIKNF